MAVALGAARRVGDPGARGHRLAGAERAPIVDLVPHHDPDIDMLVALRRGGVPMRGRYLLNPLDPDGIVDMAKLVDGVGGGGVGAAERSDEHPSDHPSLMRTWSADFCLHKQQRAT